MKFQIARGNGVAGACFAVWFLLGVVLPGRGFNTDESPITGIFFLLGVGFGIDSFIRNRKNKK